MLAYPSKIYIKMFGGGVGAVEYDDKATITKENLGKILSSIKTKLTDITSVKEGDIVHLKEGYAIVTSIHKKPLIGKMTVGVTYKTGKNTGKQEVRDLSLKEQLSVVTDKAKFEATMKATKIKDKISGKRGDPVREVNASSAKVGQEISTEDGYAKITDITTNDDGEILLDLEYTSGRFKGNKSKEVFDKRDKINLKLDKNLAYSKDNPDKDNTKSTPVRKIREKDKIKLKSGEDVEITSIEESDNDKITLKYKYLAGKRKGEESSGTYKNDSSVDLITEQSK